MPRPRLSNDAVAQALLDLTHWARDGNRLVRTFLFVSFGDALVFVNRVAAYAETANHHPDIDIRYKQVTLAYWSHDAGGITRTDVKAAASVNILFENAGM